MSLCVSLYHTLYIGIGYGNIKKTKIRQIILISEIMCTAVSAFKNVTALLIVLK